MARTTCVRGERDIRKEEWIARDSKVARVGKTGKERGQGASVGAVKCVTVL